ncbi:MAG: M48 family metalloprotease [Sandaracinobacteroides sp.]
MKPTVATAAALLAAIALLAPAPLAAQKAQKPEKARTELAKELKTAAKRDFSASQQQMLAPYATLGANSLSGFIVDHNLPVANVADMTRLLNDMVPPLLTGWTAQRPPIRVIVRADSEPAAFAHGSGLIEISTGMFEKLNSIDAVAAVLAHEIAHILLEHDAERARAKAGLDVAAGLFSSGTFYAEALKTDPKGGQTGAKPGFSMQMTPKAVDRLVVGYLADAMMSDMLLPVAKGKQEYEADRLAADLLVLSPFAADGQAESFETLIRAEAAASVRLDTAANLLTGLVAQRMLVPKAGETELETTGKTLLVAGAAAGLKSLFEKLGKSTGGEADDKKRLKALQDYARVYPDGIYPANDETAPAYRAMAARLATIRGGTAWKSAVTSARMATEAQRYLMKSKEAALNAKAGKSSIVALPERPPNLAAISENPAVPFTYTMRAMALTPGQSSAPAIKSLEAGARLQHFPSSGHELLAELYFLSRNSKAMAVAIQRGEQTSGRDSRYLPLKVGLAVLQGRRPAAETLAARCLKEGGAQVYVACASYLGYNAACAPQTEEGKMAFAAANMGRGLGDLISIQRVAGGEGKSIDCEQRAS